jgi:hypothetical protein
VRGHVVEKLLALFERVFCRSRLLLGEFAERCWNRCVRGSTLIQEAADDLLNEFDARLVECRTFIGWNGILCFAAVLNRMGGPWAVLWGFWHGVIVFDELFLDIPWLEMSNVHLL